MKDRLENGINEELQKIIAGVIRSAYTAQFNTYGAYAGTPWPLQAESTLRKKQGSWAQLLVDTGTLELSLIDPTAPFGYEELRDPWTLAIGTEVEYAAYHQAGTQFMPQRQIAPDSLLDVDLPYLVEIIGDYIASGKVTLT